MTPFARAKTAIAHTLVVSVLGMAFYGGAMAATPDAPAPNVRKGYHSPLGQSYADYLTGQYAITQGDIHASAQAFEKASRADPENKTLREQAFLIALLDGNADAAARLNPRDNAVASTAMSMSSLSEAVLALRKGRASQAMPWLEKLLVLDPNERSAQLLRPLVLAQSGKWGQALDDKVLGAEDIEKNDPLLAYFYRAQKAKLFELHAQNTDADAIYQDLIGKDATARSFFGVDYGHFLERNNRKDEALRLYEAMRDAGNDTVSADIERINAKSYEKPAKLQLKRLYGDALFTAASIALNQGDAEIALAYAQMSLWLDPTPNQRLIGMGQAYAKLRDREAAEAAWLMVPQSSPAYLSARLGYIFSLKDRDEKAAAKAETERLLQSYPANLELMLQNAYDLRDEGKPDEALNRVTKRIDTFGDKDFTWQAYFLKATLYDALDQWDNSQTAIEKALELGKDRPEILNFYGYGLINRNVDVKKGMDYVRQALKLSPRSGAIIDSLGWGYFKLGDSAQALIFIEQAVQLQPADPEINAHLGDVYLAVGRKVEAQYAYMHALSLNPSVKDAQSIKDKLARFDADTKAH
jgi:tetratricopeptide (TPR) repeat protein